MKNIFLLGFLLTGTSFYSQSLEETTEWILKQYTLYEQPMNSDNELILEDGTLSYKMVLADNYGF